MKIKEALDILGLKANFTERDLHLRYRYLANTYHPDTGHGDEEFMKKINIAHERALEYLKHKKDKAVSLDPNLKKYKNNELRTVLSKYFDVDYSMNIDIDLSPSCINFYKKYGNMTYKFMNLFYSKSEELKNNIRKSTSVSEVDEVILKFQNDMEMIRQDFIKECIANIYGNVTSSGLIKMLEKELDSKTSFNELFECIYSSYDAIMQREEKLVAKEAMISKFLSLVKEEIPTESPEYKQAISYYQKLFMDNDVDKFNKLYTEAMNFIDNYIINRKKEEVISKVELAKANVLRKFYTESLNSDPVAIKRKIEILKCVIDALEKIATIQIDNVNFDLFDRISFSDDDISLLNEIRHISNGGIYIKRHPKGEDSCFYYAKANLGTVILYQMNFINDEVKVLEVNSGDFIKEYLDIQEFFSKATPINDIMISGYCLYGYNDIYLCYREEFLMQTGYFFKTGLKNISPRENTDYTSLNNHKEAVFNIIERKTTDLGFPMKGIDEKKPANIRK